MLTYLRNITLARRPGKTALAAIVVAIATSLVLIAQLGSVQAAVSCTNGSTVDCNPTGSTLITAARFVDPAPPSGYVQCAGFINTTADDVRWDWENNCTPFKTGDLFLRVFNDTTGSIIAGAHLHTGVALTWAPSTGFNYRADSFEGEGLLDNPSLSSGLPGGVSLAWFNSDGNFCGCGRPPSGTGSCNDIFTANAANNKILYVGGNSSNLNYEAVYGPPGGKNTCSLTSEIVRLRIGIYALTTAADTTPPVVTVPANITVEATGPSGAVVTYASSALDDTDGSVATTCSPASGSTFPLGTTPVTCTATDAAGNTGSASFSVTVQDTTAPAVTVPANITVEATGPSGATVSYTSSASDIVDGSVATTCSPASGSTFPLGTTTVICTATDAAGNSGSASFSVKVQDTTAPTLTVSLSPASLWPPNHKMVKVTATVVATDISDTSVTVILTSVTSSEPDNADGDGDGNTVNDIQDAAIGTADFSVMLRAERSGTGTGRVYTVTYTATDDSGNSTTGSATVVVPHDQGKP